MPHHKTVRLHGIQIVRGVQQRLAFLQAGRLGLQIHRVRAQPRSRRPKAQPRARRIFEKRQHHRLSTQRRQLFQRIFLNFLERLGLIEKESQLVRGEQFQCQQIAKAVGHIFTQAPAPILANPAASPSPLHVQKAPEGRYRLAQGAVRSAAKDKPCVKPTTLAAPEGRHNPLQPQKKPFSQSTPLPHASTRSTRTTRSSLSISCSLTSIISVALVCTVRPTYCASIGISRCPRSISTHSETRFGLPRSNSPFIAARIVRPVYSTSSTSTRSMLSTPNDIFEDCSTACGATFDRSSRYSVISSVPTGTSTPSIPRIACAIRCASGRPRRRIPINARFRVPPLFSTIWCASRCSVRSISAADINWLFSISRMVA